VHLVESQPSLSWSSYQRPTRRSIIESLPKPSLPVQGQQPTFQGAASDSQQRCKQSRGNRWIWKWTAILGASPWVHLHYHSAWQTMQLTLPQNWINLRKICHMSSSKGASYLQLGCHHINSQQKHCHLSCSQDTGSHQGSRSNWQPTALLLAIVHHFRKSGEAPGTWGLQVCLKSKIQGSKVLCLLCSASQKDGQAQTKWDFAT